MKAYEAHISENDARDVIANMSITEISFCALSLQLCLCALYLTGNTNVLDIEIKFANEDERIEQIQSLEEIKHFIMEESLKRMPEFMEEIKEKSPTGKVIH